MTVNRHGIVSGNSGPLPSDCPDPPSGKVEAFFRAGQDTFLRAVDTAGLLEQDYRIAGLSLRLRFAGTALMEVLTPALSHLRVAPNPTPSLTMDLWDSGSTGIPMPPPPWGPSGYGPQGLITGYNNARFSTVFDLWTSALSVLDRQQSTALFWTNDARDLESSEAAAPLRLILHWWMSENQRQIVHAAAVGRSDGGLLVAGPGGSGKSTVALLCLQAGLSYAGDDYTAVSLAPEAYVHSLYSSIKIGPAPPTLAEQLAFPPLWKHLVDAEKKIFFLNQWQPESITAGFPLRAIVLPRVSGAGQTRLKPASPGFCLQTLAPSSVFQLAGSNHKSFQTLGQLVRTVPAHILELGRDHREITSAITSLLPGN